MSDSHTLPNNLDAEQSLLGCMLIDNNILVDILDSLEEVDFYQQSHKYILECMKEIFGERRPIDLVTLADKMENKQYLDKCGGLDYLNEIASVVPTAANYIHYYDIVKRDSTNRKLIRAAGDIQKFCMSSDDSLKSIQNAEKLIYDISQNHDTSTMKDIRTGQPLQEVIDKFETIEINRGAPRGVLSGFSQLDRITNGFQKGDLIVLAARPGMGKTSLSMNIVEHAILSEQKCTCVVFSLEMPQIQILQRLLCSSAKVSMTAALAGKLEHDDWVKLGVTNKALNKSKLFIDDSSRITPAEILSKCRRIKAREKSLDLVMVDYIQLMSMNTSTRGNENRAEEVGKITRELKIIAKELDVPIIALSQLRRMEGNREPQLSDLRESGAIEQDADIVMFIHRPDEAVTGKEKAEGIKNGTIVKGDADLIIAKHRNGEMGRVKLHFRGELTQFVSAAGSDEERRERERYGSAVSDSNENSADGEEDELF